MRENHENEAGIEVLELLRRDLTTYVIDEYEPEPTTPPIFRDKKTHPTSWRKRQ